MNTPSDLSIVKKTGRMSLEKYLEKYYYEFFKFLKEKYSDSKSISEMLYRYFNNIDTIPVCPVCGNKNNFINFSKGYTSHCSSKCTQNDNAVRDKLKNTNTERYGKDFYHKFNEKGKRTKLEKYGDANYNNTEQLKKTCLEKYGVDNPMKMSDIKEKSKKTCLEKYGSEYVFSSGFFNKNRTEYMKKAKQTCIEKYGGDSPMKSEQIKDKVKTTCFNKYGVLWNCMREEAHNSRNYKSTPNEFFATLLKENDIEFSREFSLGNYVYDFKIGEVLLEINPSATHNINFNPFSKTKVIDKNYHKEKLLNAKEKGYKCIFVFDWDDPYKIIYLLSNKTKIYARNCEIKEVKKKEVSEFLDKYHLQNSCKGQKICLGLYHKNELIQVLTFGKPRYNKKYEYELIRLCTRNDSIVIGGSERLFKYFISKYSPKSIISYCDISKFTGNVYSHLGFVKEKESNPSCHWVNIKTKQIINNNILLKLGFDKIFGTNYGKNTSNIDLMLQHQFVQVYDCGQDTYTWKKQED